MQPVVADLAEALGRFGGYGPRLAGALAKVQGGDVDWFTKPTIDSYHTVWFELHENLLATLGIERLRAEPTDPDRQRGGHLMARFGSVITAMITPFDDDGRVDLEGAAALAEWLVAQGNDGLVVTGSTGEASMLTDDEQVEVWRAVRAAVDVPLIAGIGHQRHPPRLRAHRPGRRRTASTPCWW